MRIGKIDNHTHKGVLDGTVTNILRACDTNEMVNAVGLDVGAMVIPRSYYDTKARNEFAGAETFFREISGTFINCVSAGLFAQIISKIATKQIMPDTKIKSDSWYSKDSLGTLQKAWESGNNSEQYIETVLNNLSGRDGHRTRKFSDIDWNNIEWIDEQKWDKYEWKNPEYIGIQHKLKSEENIKKALSKAIQDNNLQKDDKKQFLSIIEKRLTNALGAERDVCVKIGNTKMEGTLFNIIRDTYDMATDVFCNKNIDTKLAMQKIKKVNKIKTFGALTASCVLGLTNQYLNRKITEKRTGKKGFVGDVDFTSDTHDNSEKDKLLWAKKAGASAIMLGMVLSVMRVKNLSDFVQKLEFTGPITSGNAIKTVYAANITGRFIAADNGTELRESMTRDYLGFLNWLVFGGFFAKGIANILDRKGKNLFNYKKEGTGIKHWLNDMTLKTHNEVASKGTEFAKKNLRKLNIAQAGGIAYSAITLGILLPMLNKKVTELRSRNKSKSDN